MMKRAFVTNNLRFSVRNKAAAKLRKPPKVFSVCFLTSKTDYLRIFSPFSVFYGFNIARIDINFKWVRILSARLTPPRRRRGTIEDGGGGIIPDRLRWIRKINVGRGLAPAVIFVYYVPPFL